MASAFPNLLFAVAAGGALGALGRHYLSAAVMRALGPGFPFGTLAVNAAGGFLMGLLAALLALKLEAAPTLRAFLVVGLLGGFTTFSAFSLEVALMIERHQLGLAALYVLASVCLSVAALFGGMAIGRAVT